MQWYFRVINQVEMGPRTGAAVAVAWSIDNEPTPEEMCSYCTAKRTVELLKRSVC